MERRRESSICTACGTQFDSEAISQSQRCKICDDPRQFVPRSGQSWTTMDTLKENHKNVWKDDAKDPRVWSIWTEPKFAIGQRCFLLETEGGNILWDLISLLDNVTIAFIKSKGGVKAIVISHPHYYTTYIEWARTFNCPVYFAADDQEWICQHALLLQMPRFIHGPPGAVEEILPGVTAIKAGGHFPGSLVLHWEKKLFIADTIVTVPSAYTPHPRPPGQTSYSFQWSIPNMIPLPPSDILNIWRAIEPYNFDTTHGAFVGMDVRDFVLKERMLESMKIQVRGEGWEQHEMLDQSI